ncbi:MAG: alpha/beta hydrolase [Spirochaetales bacterium]|nr:alpha/beta hydrolase [Spirochaetales bacterium]
MSRNLAFLLSCVLFWACSATPQPTDDLLANQMLATLLKSEFRTAVVQTGQISVNGVSLDYASFGTGRPVVVLHGGPGLEYNYLLDQFFDLAQDHRLIFYNRRALGNSGGTTASATVTNSVADLEALRQAFGLGKINLLGHSFGGILAMKYGIAHPANLNMLMLVDSTGPVYTTYNTFVGNLAGKAGFSLATYSTYSTDASTKASTASSSPTAANLQAARDAIKTLNDYLFKFYFVDQSKYAQLNFTYSDQSVKNTYTESNAMWGSLPLIDAGADGLADAGSWDFTANLSAITAPSFLFHCEEDVVPHSNVDTIAGGLTNAASKTTKKVSGCGHFPYIEKPTELFSSLRSFIAAN